MNSTRPSEAIPRIGTHYGDKRAIQQSNPKDWRRQADEQTWSAALLEHGLRHFEVKHFEIGATERDLEGNGVYCQAP